jgi:hypothetical protein
MGLGWLTLGIVIAVLLFIFIPGLFNTLVNVVQWIIHAISNIKIPQELINSTNATSSRYPFFGSIIQLQGA